MKKVSFTEEQKQYIKDNYSTKTLNEIGEYLGVGEKPLARIIKEIGLGEKPIVRYSAWTVEIQNLIKELYPTVDTEELSKQTGISGY